jgi:simple sugar transport system permease protein
LAHRRPGPEAVIGLKEYFAKALNHSWTIRLGELAVPAGMLAFFACLALLLHLFFRTRSGAAMVATGRTRSSRACRGLT